MAILRLKSTHFLILLRFLTVPEFKSGLGHVKLDGVALIPCGVGTNPL